MDLALLEDFDYTLPKNRIAQVPQNKRDKSRLLVYHRSSSAIEHAYFSNIISYCDKDDLFIFNDTMVFNARVLGKRIDTGGTIELLLSRPVDKNIWECLLNPGKRVREGMCYSFGDGLILGEVLSLRGSGLFYMKLCYKGDLFLLLDRIGKVPLPPYIKRPKRNEKKDSDFTRYQTVYAKNRGACAAPTAGLHFSKRILSQFDSAEIRRKYVTLHVGLGTFQPLRKTTISENRLHQEYFKITADVASSVNRAIKNDKKVFIVGTTTLRALESSIDKKGKIVSGEGWTDIFIYPPYNFKINYNLITNFHLPKSSLMLLVASLISRDELLYIYNEAKKNKYRFYSYGDAMMIMD
ncbi:tRNA preQ1(34) S-adenosylmethionine ribosyltransferase-isomerase QueA [Chlamydiota bacterium]